MELYEFFILNRNRFLGEVKRIRLFFIVLVVLVFYIILWRCQRVMIKRNILVLMVAVFATVVMSGCFINSSTDTG